VLLAMGQTMKYLDGILYYGGTSCLHAGLDAERNGYAAGS
jgi:hypothetical protein